MLVVTAENRGTWLSRRSLIAEPIRAAYCIENMVESFIAALRLDSTVPPSGGGVADGSLMADGPTQETSR
jgi:hypothetical protein